MLFNIFVSELCLSKKLLIIFTTPNKSHAVYQVVPIPIPLKNTSNKIYAAHSNTYYRPCSELYCFILLKLIMIRIFRNQWRILQLRSRNSTYFRDLITLLWCICRWFYSFLNFNIDNHLQLFAYFQDPF